MTPDDARALLAERNTPLPPSHAADRALRRAAEVDEPDLELVEALLVLGASPDVPDLELGPWAGPSLLHTAVQDEARSPLAALLIAAGADLELGQADHTPLMTALRKGNHPMARQLIGSGAKLDRFTPRGWSPLIYTIEKDLWDLFGHMLDHGADPAARNQHGISALSWSLRPDTPLRYLEAMLDRGADPDHAGPTGDTLLHRAAWRNNADAARRLLAAGAELERQNQAGWTPWMTATRLGSDAVRSVLEVQGAATWHEAQIELARAMIDCDLEAALHALSDGADPNQPDDLGVPPLLRAAGALSVELVEVLLERGADPDGLDLDGNGSVAWTFLGEQPEASQADRIEVIRHLIIGTRRTGCGAPLVLASRAQQPELFELLLEAGFDPGELRDGDSLLFQGIERDEPRLISLFLEAGGEPGAAPDGQPGCVLLALRRGDQELLDRLLEAGADPDATREPGRETALYLAAGQGDVELAERLLAAGASPLAIRTRVEDTPDRGIPADDDAFATPLSAARKPELIALLRDHATLVLRARQGEGWRQASPRGALAEWIRRGDTAAALALIEAGARLEPSDPWAPAPLAIAAEVGDLQITDALLHRGARRVPLGCWWDPPLLRAARGGHLDVMGELIESGAEAHPYDLLMAAIEGDQPEVVDAAVQLGAPLRFPGQPPAICVAVRDGKLRAARRLLAAGADLQATDLEGLTPLEHALCNDQLDAVKVLLELGVAPSLGLLAATLEHRARKVFAFLKPRIRIARVEDRRALYAAALSTGKPTGVLALLEEGVDHEGSLNAPALLAHLTPAQARKLADAIEGVRQELDLLEAALPLTIEPPPLHLAVRSRKLKEVDALLEQGVDVDLVDARGTTALMWAAWTCQPTIAQRLREAGANARYVSPRDQTAASIARHQSGAIAWVFDDVWTDEDEARLEALRERYATWGQHLSDDLNQFVSMVASARVDLDAPAFGRQTLHGATEDRALRRFLKMLGADTRLKVSDDLEDTLILAEEALRHVGGIPGPRHHIDFNSKTKLSTQLFLNATLPGRMDATDGTVTGFDHATTFALEDPRQGRQRKAKEQFIGLADDGQQTLTVDQRGRVVAYRYAEGNTAQVLCSSLLQLIGELVLAPDQPPLPEQPEAEAEPEVPEPVGPAQPEPSSRSVIEPDTLELLPSSPDTLELLPGAEAPEPPQPEPPAPPEAGARSALASPGTATSTGTKPADEPGAFAEPADASAEPDGASAEPDGAAEPGPASVPASVEPIAPAGAAGAAEPGPTSVPASAEPGALAEPIAPDPTEAPPRPAAIALGPATIALPEPPTRPSPSAAAPDAPPIAPDEALAAPDAPPTAPDEVRAEPPAIAVPRPSASISLPDPGAHEPSQPRAVKIVMPGPATITLPTAGSPGASTTGPAATAVPSTEPPGPARATIAMPEPDQAVDAPAPAALEVPEPALARITLPEAPTIGASSEPGAPDPQEEAPPERPRPDPRE